MGHRHAKHWSFRSLGSRVARQRHQASGVAIVQAGGTRAILSVMQRHASVAQVQGYCCHKFWCHFGGAALVRVRVTVISK